MAAKTGVRIFQAEFPAYARAALWLKALFGGHAVLVEHNIEFHRLRCQLGDLKEREHELLRHVELTLCNRVDLVIAVSRLDRELLVRHGVAESRVHVVPHGVDLWAPGTGLSSTNVLAMHGVSASAPVIVYHGTYAYPPNLEAVRILSTEIVPRLHLRGVYPLVLAIGPHAPKASLPNVVFTGAVASVPEYLMAADVAVVPLTQGGGTRMKILDYFAAGVPVVTTRKGAEGLELTDGKEAVIRDGFERITDAVAYLLQNPSHASELRARGREFVAPLDWFAIGCRYRDLFDAHSMLRKDRSGSAPCPGASRG